MNSAGLGSKFVRAVLMAGFLAAFLCALAIGFLSWMRGFPAWLPLNATAHVLHGPSAAAFMGVDLMHTALGTIIHLASAIFWAAVAFMVLRAVGGRSAAHAWMAGLGTALIAGIVDYGLMPSRLTPGWELVLSPPEVAAGLFALGVGLAAGLHAARPFSQTTVNP